MNPKLYMFLILSHKNELSERKNKKNPLTKIFLLNKGEIGFALILKLTVLPL